MKKQKLLAFALCILLMVQLLPLPVFAEEAEDGEEQIEAAVEAQEDLPLQLDCKGAILIELNSDTTVFEHNADERLYPASLTKIMTCLLALERGNLSDEVTVDASLFEGMDSDASIVGLQDGEKLTLEELLYCVMVPSANDASIVVADHIAGSVEAFVGQMNERAKALGCKDTHFVNPDGLHDEEHYTTARDMSIITKEALKNEIFRKICGTAEHEVPATNLSSANMVYTTNYFLSYIITQKYYWEKASGVKTGFTTPAGRCLVTLVEEGDFSYLSVVLGAGTTYDEAGEAVFGSFTESRRLIEYGLENFAFVSVLSHLAPIAQVPVSSAAVKSVVVAPEEDVSALLPAKFDETKLTTTYNLTSGDTLEAPLQADEVVGTVSVFYDGKEVGKTNVRTISAVERNKILAAPTQKDPGFLRLIPVFVIIVAVLLLLMALLRRRRRHKRRSRRRR